MQFPWSKSHHRQALLAEPLPEAWRRILWANIRQYRVLPPGEQRTLEDGTRILVAEKNWEGVQGLTLTDEIKVTIAGMASLLVLGTEHDYYPNVETIIVYPGSFQIPTQKVETQGVIAEMRVHRGRLGGTPGAGDCFLVRCGVGHRPRRTERGFARVRAEAGHARRRGGRCAVDSNAQIERWSRVMSAEYEALVAQTQRGERGVLNPYGATNAAEFFAVATETFFENARELQAYAPGAVRRAARFLPSRPGGAGITEGARQ